MALNSRIKGRSRSETLGAANEGRNGQRGGARRDDSQHAASRPGSRRRTGATPTRNARQQRQHDRLLAFQQAVRHRLSCIFRAWAEATRAEEDRLDDLTEDVRHATEHAREPPPVHAL